MGQADVAAHVLQTRVVAVIDEAAEGAGGRRRRCHDAIEILEAQRIREISLIHAT